jgi:thiol-disulfide isomerase/thioredoxin
MQRNAIIGGAVAGIIAGLGAVYWIAQDERKTEAPPEAVSGDSSESAGGAWQTGVTRDLAKGAMAAFVVRPAREPVADAEFFNEANEKVHISQWRGKVVLLNLWATWCAPCRKEMPSLAALQTQIGSNDFEVVAVSLDRKGADASSAFLIETNATALKLYVDPSAAMLDKFQSPGLPTTVLLDRDGNEIGRLLGPAEWSSTEAITLIRAALAETKGEGT